MSEFRLRDPEQSPAFYDRKHQGRPCTYSRKMHQPYPRRCIECGEPEVGRPQGITLSGVPDKHPPLNAGLPEPAIPPRVGDWVLYTLTEANADEINHRRDTARHEAINVGVLVPAVRGNRVAPGDQFPMLITRLWGTEATSVVQGTVFLDGTDTLWVTSVGPGKIAGTYQREPRG